MISAIYRIILKLGLILLSSFFFLLLYKIFTIKVNLCQKLLIINCFLPFKIFLNIFFNYKSLYNFIYAIFIIFKALKF